MAKLGERPKECNDTSHPPLAYRVNKIWAKFYNIVFPGGLKYRALNSHASLEAVLRSGKSFIRFGDAEAKLMLGGDWPTQRGSRDLARGLRRIFEDYAPSSNYLVGVANSRLTQDLSVLKAMNIHRTWRNARYCLRTYLKASNPVDFLEANLFRVGPDGLDRKSIERLWENKTQIVLVHNHIHYLEWFQNRYPSKTAYWVSIPEKNFFEALSATQEKVMESIHKHRLEKEQLAILIAAGAGGKVLNYNLCQKDADYLCYDMGNFFHMQLNRTSVLAELAARRRKGPTE